jgi:hypothetical protein
MSSTTILILILISSLVVADERDAYRGTNRPDLEGLFLCGEQRLASLT